MYNILKYEDEEFVMLAIREIRQVDAGSVTIKIPETFRKKKIEIILLPYPERASKERQTDKLMQFDQLVENARSRNLKIDSAIDIDAIMNEMNNGLC